MENICRHYLQPEGSKRMAVETITSNRGFGREGILGALLKFI